MAQPRSFLNCEGVVVATTFGGVVCLRMNNSRHCVVDAQFDLEKKCQKKSQFFLSFIF